MLDELFELNDFFFQVNFQGSNTLQMRESQEEEIPLSGVDRYMVFNRYTLFLCFTFELVILSQIANVAYLMFAGNLFQLFFKK